MRAAVLVLHVLSAVTGFGALSLTGVYAGIARRQGARTPSARRYFAPGTNWVARSLYAVPALGVVLVATSHGADRYAQPWLWVSILIWAAAAGLAETAVWPGERRIQTIVAELASPQPDGRQGAELVRVCRRVEGAAWAVNVLFVAAIVLMVARPGGGG